MNENEKRHLEHPFYHQSAEYRSGVRREQILKGSYKYPEPFTSKSWTPEQLLRHAMQENVDQEHYIYGLYELLHLERAERRERIESALKGISYLVNRLKEDNVLYHMARGVELILESLYEADKLTKEDSI